MTALQETQYNRYILNMNTDHKAVTAALKTATSALKAQYSTSPRKGGLSFWAVKITASPTSKAEIEELCASDERFEGWKFFTSKNGCTHGVYALV